MSSLSNPQLEINNIVVAIKPNSLSYKDGWGNINQRAQSAGGNSIELIGSEDAETKKGMVKFMMYTTKENVDLLSTWLRQSREANGNAIRLSESGFTRSFPRMKILEEPERSVGSDGEFEVMFEGLPALR